MNQHRQTAEQDSAGPSADVANVNNRLSTLRSMFANPRMTYAAIGQQFGISKQRIGQLARKLKTDRRRRERERIAHRLTFSNKTGYSPEVLMVIRSIKRLGFEVLPYRTMRSNGWLRTACRRSPADQWRALPDLRPSPHSRKRMPW